MAEEKNHLEVAAQNYLKRHKIPELFQNMTAMLVFYRPKNPKIYLANYLKDLNNTRIAEGKGEDVRGLMDDENISALFRLLDITGKGYISSAQYKQAMKTLGVKNYDISPIGSESNQIDFEVFERHVKQGLQKTWSTFNEALTEDWSSFT